MKKKPLFFTCMFAIFMGMNAFANKASLFQYDEQSIDQKFADLNELENIVVTNQGITLSDLKSGNLNLSPELKLKLNNLMDGMNLMEPPLGIPGFWWGCVLGPIGILCAYLISDQDKDQTKSALWGCLVGWGASFLLYVLIWVLIIGNSFWYF